MRDGYPNNKVKLIGAAIFGHILQKSFLQSVTTQVDITVDRSTSELHNTCFFTSAECRKGSSNERTVALNAVKPLCNARPSFQGKLDALKGFRV
ncbi:hypothetical protein AVEN_266338-1 [Araneus ventricosus]|uniref:Uncharacterized protein n=1 Tax=Araneus ventricosus TaxID=182803 RepID=A0A4Y2CRG4_ARAVE|nr:hypothetical protein AVEN_266338-1 [Araneus ventricosus]